MLQVSVQAPRRRVSLDGAGALHLSHLPDPRASYGSAANSSNSLNMRDRHNDAQFEQLPTSTHPKPFALKLEMSRGTSSLLVSRSPLLPFIAIYLLCFCDSYPWIVCLEVSCPVFKYTVCLIDLTVDIKHDELNVHRLRF